MKACSGGGGDCVVVGCGDGEWWLMGVAASDEERERERESVCVCVYVQQKGRRREMNKKMNSF